MSYRTIDRFTHEEVIMASITEKQEKEIDKTGSLVIKLGAGYYNVTPKSIIGYGNIDFTDGSDDMIYLSEQRFLDHLIERGIWVPARYNYDEHCCYSKCRKPEYFDTTRPELLCKYVHAMLGKPKTVLIFKNRSGIHIIDA